MSSLRKRQYIFEANTDVGKRLLVKATSHRARDELLRYILNDPKRNSLKSFTRDTGKGVFEVTPEEMERIQSNRKARLFPKFKDGPDLFNAWRMGPMEGDWNREPMKEDAGD